MPKTVQKRSSEQKSNDSTHIITDYDILLFRQGRHFNLYDKLGCHLCEKGADFAVWAPNASRVSVIGDFNGWDNKSHPMNAREDHSGVWETHIDEIQKGQNYKYFIESAQSGHMIDKGDPYGFLWENAPNTASIAWDLDYEWNDSEWMAHRGEKCALNAPMSIYEVHLGSWKRVPEENDRHLTYREMAPLLADYVAEMGFTHVELLPIMEHPFYGSWGYQTVGYFAPTSRYGTPQDFMYLIDYLHQRGIGVILDWVPSHFPANDNGLVYFDGTHLYEHADPQQGFHPDWKTYIFNFGRHEVRAFLISNALFWLDKYHIDGLRVDAVASMLYLDYSRREGEWIPNKHGGRENIEAIDFLRDFNTTVYEQYPDVQTIAEESTAWPMVSRPTYVGGLGFGYKWNMGWMHDTLDYFSKEPVYRKYHHNQLTFSLLYAFTENFMLPLSHDEVVYGKGSLLGRMPGDDWQKRAGLRTLLGYQFVHPGKPMIFMGGEFGQWQEWNHDSSLDWHLLDNPGHEGIRRWVRDVNTHYRGDAALYEGESESWGFEWIDCTDVENSILAFLRFAENRNDPTLVLCNLTPIPRYNYIIGLPRGGKWKEVLNSDATLYGGSGQGNIGGVTANPVPYHGKSHSSPFTLPPLSMVVFKPE